MARFGQGMINSLINPSYAQGMNQMGLMAGSLPGRIREQEAEQAKLKAQQAAQASMFSLLNQADPNDPNTMNAVTQMGAAYGMDPKATQAALIQAQTASQNREKMEIQRANAVFAKADAEHKAEQRQTAEVQSKIAQAVEQAAARSPEQLEAVILRIPEEHRAFAREQAKAIQDFEKGRQDRLEAALAKEPLDADTLKHYASVVGEDAITAYKNQASGPTAGSARTRLENLYNDVLKSRLTARNAADAEKLKPPTEGDRAYARAAIEQAFVTPGSWFFNLGSSESMSPEDREIFVQAVASKVRTEPNWVPNEKNLKDYWAEINGQEAAAPAKETGDTPPDGISQEDWDAMPPEDKALFR